MTFTVLQARVVKILNDSSRNLMIAVTITEHKLIADIAAAQEVFSTRQRLGEDVIARVAVGIAVRRRAQRHASRDKTLAEVTRMSAVTFATWPPLTSSAVLP